jgi:hypothetical protein
VRYVAALTRQVRLDVCELFSADFHLKSISNMLLVLTGPGRRNFPLHLGFAEYLRLAIREMVAQGEPQKDLGSRKTQVSAKTQFLSPHWKRHRRFSTPCPTCTCSSSSGARTR